MTDSERKTLPLLAAPPRLHADGTALFLDLDGTLAEIVEAPQLVRPDPRRSGILRALVREMGGRVAVLTGRTLSDADRILETSVGCIGAVHGLERRMPDGGVVTFLPSRRLPEARQLLNAFVEIEPRVAIEDKGSSLALHYRHAPGAAAGLRRTASRVAKALGLTVQEGAMVIELRTTGPDKGDALRSFSREAPFAGFTPVMVGDDLTDEAAFTTATELGGYGVLVGPPRPTQARYRLGSVAEVLTWLEAAYSS